MKRECENGLKRVKMGEYKKGRGITGRERKRDVVKGVTVDEKRSVILTDWERVEYSWLVRGLGL